jgi:hypothetical protein
MTTINTSFLARATAIAARGFSTIPLQGKLPLTSNGAKDKTRDPERIAVWAQEFPSANAAIVADESYIVLESDDAAKLEEWLGRLGAKIPRTFKQQARENRPHWVFRRPAFDVQNLNIHGVFEVKAINQYVVGFGSIHPKTGDVYRIIEDREPAEAPRQLWDALLEIRAAGDGEKTAASLFVPLTTVGLLRAEVVKYPYNGDWDVLLDDTAAQERFRIEETERHFSIQRLGATFRNLLDDCLEKRIERMTKIRDHFCDDGGRLVSDGEVEKMAEWLEKKESSPSPIATISAPVKLETPAADVQAEEKAFQFVLAPFDKEIEGPFALRSVSLIAGSSGSAKSTWAYDMLAKQQRGEMVLGRKSYGRKALVIMHDRSEDELERTFRRMGIKVSEFPFVTITAAEEKKSPAEVVHRYMKDRKPVPEVVLIEGLDMWARQAGNMEVATDIMRNLRDVAQHYNVAIIGTVGCPKQKPKEKYALARDKVFGSQAWGRRADTIIVFAEYTDDDKKGHRAGDRDVHVLLRNAPEQRVTMRFDKGLLVEVKPPIEVKIISGDGKEAHDSRRMQFERWVGNQESFTMADASEANPEVSYHTLLRWAKGLRNGWRAKKTQTGLVFRQSHAKAANAN